MRSGWAAQVDCRSSVHAYWQDIVDHATTIAASYDPKQAARCVAETLREWQDCHDRKLATSNTDDVCARVFSAPLPRREPGEACESSMDCAQPADAVALCVRLAHAGQVIGTCMLHAVSDVGGPCGGAMGQTTTNCRAPAVCGADRLCHLPADQGEPCGDFGGDTCAAGYVCDRGNTGLCQRATAVGAPCQRENDCENFACINGVCRIAPPFSLALGCQQ